MYKAEMDVDLYESAAGTPFVMLLDVIQFDVSLHSNLYSNVAAPSSSACSMVIYFRVAFRPCRNKHAARSQTVHHIVRPAATAAARTRG